MARTLPVSRRGPGRCWNFTRQPPSWRRCCADWLLSSSLTFSKFGPRRVGRGHRALLFLKRFAKRQRAGLPQGSRVAEDGSLVATVAAEARGLRLREPLFVVAPAGMGLPPLLGPKTPSYPSPLSVLGDGSPQPSCLLRIQRIGSPPGSQAGATGIGWGVPAAHAGLRPGSPRVTPNSVRICWIPAAAGAAVTRRTGAAVTRLGRGTASGRRRGGTLPSGFGAHWSKRMTFGTACS